MDQSAYDPAWPGPHTRRQSHLARLLDRFRHHTAPDDLPLLHAITAGIHNHSGTLPLGEDAPFSAAEQTLADIFSTIVRQLELDAAPIYSRCYDPLAAEYVITLRLGHDYLLEGSYGNVLVQNAYPNRGWVSLQRMPDPGTAGSPIVVRSAAFQCAQADEHVARTALGVLQPALRALRVGSWGRE